MQPRRLSAADGSSQRRLAEPARPVTGKGYSLYTVPVAGQQGLAPVPSVKIRSGTPDDVYAFGSSPVLSQQVPLAAYDAQQQMPIGRFGAATAAVPSADAGRSQRFTAPAPAPVPELRHGPHVPVGPRGSAKPWAPENTPQQTYGAAKQRVQSNHSSSLASMRPGAGAGGGGGAGAGGSPLGQPRMAQQQQQQYSISHLRDSPVPDTIATASVVSIGSTNSSSNSGTLGGGTVAESASAALTGTGNSTPVIVATAAATGTGDSVAAATAPIVASAAAEILNSELGRLTLASNNSSQSGTANGQSTGGGEQKGMRLGEDEDVACRRFTYAQLLAATDNFSRANLLSRGSMDAVFKGKLMGCKVAVKRLEGGGWQGPIEYRTEVEVLSRMRHPNIVLLMGHCPEEHCLVYEYLSGGSLQESLEKRPGSQQLKWFDRIKVMSQVVDALLYLHQHEPPIVHRDLNPSNILIDRNNAVKLADVGLARLLHEDDALTAGPKGTSGYIDPAEMMTLEVSTLGDVYAFGLICLQLLMGEGSIQALQKKLLEAGTGSGGSRGLSRAADAITASLDASTGDWPAEMARQLAVMALKCTDPKRMRRPDLAEEVQPLLQRAAEQAAEASTRALNGLSSQLTCPLSKVRMTDPVLAADGFTYERSAIEQWLQRWSSSPITGQPLEHTFLTPNNGLRLILMQQ